jgi:cyanate lyase
MTAREQLTEKILTSKRKLGLKWSAITSALGASSPIVYTAALLGQFPLTAGEAEKAAALFDLDPLEATLLTEPPHRGAGTVMPPTDPLIYRFYELVQNYGSTWKALIEEEFGDGIMSAIDFDFAFEREPNPKGDRVRITMSGKFLPFKYYGATGNNQALGYKEE